MATQPQKDNLIKLFQETISTNKETIEENKLTIIESQKIIDDFDPSCKGIDGRIVSLVGQINTLKGEIASLNLQAYNTGCGTTIGATNIYPDTAIDNYYNISDSSYEDDEPYTKSSQTLTSSNVGFGTFVVYRKDNTQAASLGISYANIGSCDPIVRNPPIACNSGTCSNFASQIVAKQSEIATLRSQVELLIDPINALKTERIPYQTRRWSDLHTNKELRVENDRIKVAIDVLNDPKYDSLI